VTAPAAIAPVPEGTGKMPVLLSTASFRRRPSLSEAGCRLKSLGSQHAPDNHAVVPLAGRWRKPCRRNAPEILATTRTGLRRLCSQILTTTQPARRRARLTNRSRALFAVSFRRQNARPVRRSLGVGGLSAIELFFSHLFVFVCRGQPCQKQPSTNTATRSLAKMKSVRMLVGRDRRARRFPS